MERSSDKFLYIIRHGQTDWNLEGRTQGQTDIPLNETGKRQAEEFSSSLPLNQFDVIYSSDLVRAHETALIIARPRKLEVITHRKLREKGHGPLEGRLWSEYLDLLKTRETEFNSYSREEKRKFKIIPDIESDEEVIQRFLEFTEEISVTDAVNLLVVTHGFYMLSLLEYLDYGTHAELPPTSIKNTAYMKLKLAQGNIALQEVSGVEKVA